VTSTSRRHALAPFAIAGASTSDPLLKLLQLYESERGAFDAQAPTEQLADQDWDRIAEETWSHTQNEILEHQPPATTAAGALLALDHVLRDEYLFGERDECPDQQMLWLLIKAARDYIATTEFLDVEK
jgi:hypothetical protein